MRFGVLDQERGQVVQWLTSKRFERTGNYTKGGPGLSCSKFCLETVCCRRIQRAQFLQSFRDHFVRLLWSLTI